MKKGLLITFSVLAIIGCYAQSPKKKAGVVDTATIVDYEIEPQFPGGNEAFMKFVSKNLKYPKGEVEAQGKVIISFMIQKDGRTTDFKIMRSLHPAFDKETLIMLRKMPKWKPGMQCGKPVKCGYTVPLMFSIKEE
nr:energy transducer TonB [uncultured Mucilaginibacter sp.]